MDRDHPELALERSGSGSSTIQHFAVTQSDTIARAKSPAVPAEPAFDPSHSHRVWRMMNALIDAKPEWADQDSSVRIRAGPPCGSEAFGRALAISTSIWTVL